MNAKKAAETEIEMFFSQECASHGLISKRAVPLAVVAALGAAAAAATLAVPLIVVAFLLVQQIEQNTSEINKLKARLKFVEFGTTELNDTIAVRKFQIKPQFNHMKI